MEEIVGEACPADDAARAALARPLEQAEGLPGYYYGAGFYEVEQRLLFPRGWAAVAVGMQIPNPGDILPIELAGWPLILVRQADGEVAAFHNICRHRALLLVSEPCRGEKSIRCPWHAWRYGLDGRLLATPEIGGAREGNAAGFDKAELALKPVRVGRWLDYIFVNIDGSAPPFEAYILPLARLLGNYRFDALAHMYSFDDVYKGNWKIVTESGIEDYHLPFGHPQLNAHLLRNSTPHVDYPVFGISTNTKDFAAEKAEQRAWNATLIDLPRHDESLPRILFSMNVFPTGTILVTSDHLALGVHLPDGPDLTKVRVNIYTHREAATASHYANGRQRVRELWAGVLPQDAAFIEGAMATMKFRDGAGIKTRFAPYWEAAVHGFQAHVLEAIR
jgi:choline monooxygenase